MRFYNIETKGKMMLEKRTSDPTYTNDDQGRIYFKDGHINLISDPSGSALCNYELIDSVNGDTRYGGLNQNNAWCGENQFYNKFIVEKRTSHPSYTLADVGRMYSCGGYMHYIGDQGVGSYLLCTYLLVDNFWACTNYAQCWSSNNFESNASWYRACVSIYDTQPTAANPSFLVCRNSPGYPAAGVAIQAQVQNGVGVYGCSENNYGIQGRSNTSYAVAGNTGYYNYSSQYLKHLESVCLSNCVRETPLEVYKYYWEDANNEGFNQSIGPVAEEFNKTFNVNNVQNQEEYEGVWTVDGAAFGLALENLKEIDQLKEIIVEMYSCIKKLENKEI